MRSNNLVHVVACN
ncbi:hypothetical protein F383_19804 [Gossypium arboreum]|uniref:Uncharacterized protein n=1 Tax=Gossypium arboreum TaxID=29729 RepID=A0A0B0NR19_GOSAR|nr:hypothetical protein F383_19804 [Gossypium arboreum]